MVAPILQFPGIPGGSELLIVLLIAVLLFGANKIPKLARSSGQAIGEFQKGREEVEQELSDIKEGETSVSETSSATETATESAGESTSTSDSTATESDAGTTSSNN